MTQTSSIIVSPAETLHCPDSLRGSEQDDGAQYPTGAKRMVILVSMAIATFLVALVRRVQVELRPGNNAHTSNRTILSLAPPSRKLQMTLRH